ncbi:MAG: hypothetical protein H6943_07275 [Zoogloeaceae bacterium]|nr:hypothetical protein [Zoogloeaceae bacterium]
MMAGVGIRIGKFCVEKNSAAAPRCAAATRTMRNGENREQSKYLVSVKPVVESVSMLRFRFCTWMAELVVQKSAWLAGPDGLAGWRQGAREIAIERKFDA